MLRKQPKRPRLRSNSCRAGARKHSRQGSRTDLKRAPMPLRRLRITAAPARKRNKTTAGRTRLHRMTSCRYRLKPDVTQVTRAKNKKKPRMYAVFCVQLRGLEPLPKYMDMNLNHARMPIPPQLLIKERETGIEPATPTLARWCSTAEPLAHAPFAAQGV